MKFRVPIQVWVDMEIDRHPEAGEEFCNTVAGMAGNVLASKIADTLIPKPGKIYVYMTEVGSPVKLED